MVKQMTEVEVRDFALRILWLEDKEVVNNATCLKAHYLPRFLEAQAAKKRAAYVKTATFS